jgi:serine/threonine-protein kinase
VTEAVTTELPSGNVFDIVCGPESATPETVSDDHDDAHLSKHILASLENRILEDRYQIGRELGRGGMGVVFAGWDTQLEREVAIKVLAISPQRLARTQRFLREARIASRLNHPGIMAIHEFGVCGDRLAFIVMRLLEGQTLRALLASCQDRLLELPQLLTVFLQTCQAVAFAHDQGVIHRDIKPDNIMVGHYGVVTVMDWGLAKTLPNLYQQGDSAVSDDSHEWPPADARSSPSTELQTDCGTIFGTSSYLPPEQARGDTGLVDKRSDVFALGAILCEILTGLPPFTTGSALSNWVQSAKGCLDSALERLDASRGPPPIINLAKRCLAAAPQDRPFSAQALVDEVTAYLEDGQRRAEQQLVQFFDLSVDLFCIAGRNGYFSRVNENFPRLLGYPATELLSRKFLEFVHPEDINATVAEVERLGRGEPTIQFLNRYRHADGNYLWLEWTARSVPHEGLIYAVARDVTERMSADEARAHLERERFRLAEIVDSADDAIVSKDLSGVVLSWNRGAEKLFGYTADEMVGKSVTKLIPPEKLREEEAILALLRAGKRVDHFETVRITKDGRRIDISASVSPIHDAHGQFIAAAKIARDIGDRKTLEADLERSRKELADFTENAVLPLHWVDGNGTILWANQAELDFLGYSREEYIGAPITRFHADPPIIADILRRLTSGECLNGYEARLRAKDGSIKQVAIHSNVYTEHGRFLHTRCFTIDNSAQKQLLGDFMEEKRLVDFVAETCSDLTADTDLGRRLQGAASRIQRYFHADGVSVWLQERVSQRWHVAASAGRQDKTEEQAEVVAHIARERTPHSSPRPHATDGARLPADVVGTGLDVDTFTGVPVVCGGQVLAVVTLIVPRPPRAAEQRALGSACDALALALQAGASEPNTGHP